VAAAVGRVQVVPDSLEVSVDHGAPRCVREVVASVVALDKRDDGCDEGCEVEDVHGKNRAPMNILPRVAELPNSIDFLPHAWHS
jgi:hypothetical protein